MQVKGKVVTFAMKLECHKEQLENYHSNALQGCPAKKPYEETDECEKLSTETCDQGTR